MLVLKTAGRRLLASTSTVASRQAWGTTTPPGAAQSERERLSEVKGRPAAASPPRWLSLVSTPPQHIHGSSADGALASVRHCPAGGEEDQANFQAQTLLEPPAAAAAVAKSQNESLRIQVAHLLQHAEKVRSVNAPQTDGDINEKIEKAESQSSSGVQRVKQQVDGMELRGQGEAKVSRVEVLQIHPSAARALIMQPMFELGTVSAPRPHYPERGIVGRISGWFGRLLRALMFQKKWDIELLRAACWLLKCRSGLQPAEIQRGSLNPKHTSCLVGTSTRWSRTGPFTVDKPSQTHRKYCDNRQKQNSSGSQKKKVCRINGMMGNVVLVRALGHQSAALLVSLDYREPKRGPVGSATGQRAPAFFCIN
ncbi:hypothetical protein Q8A73_018129 [Channa argus]|nr:hypothetical protein Q8A73_018129 [Channa argus]